MGEGVCDVVSVVILCAGCKCNVKGESVHVVK